LLAFLAGADPSSPEDASLLIAEGRACGVLGRLAQRLLAAPREAAVPPQMREQLAAAAVHARGFRRDVWRELGHIEQALAGLQQPVIVLKGASYVLLGLPAADGRIFSDIDVLVERSAIGAAEASLMLGGWSTGKLDAYDQRYYREWSHEIPPMTHLHRGTTIDLHHCLVMPTCRVKVDSATMIADAVPVGEHGFWWRLKDEDMVLHAASHLVLNSEFDRGLRDLWDIDLLYRHFAARSANFPRRLQARAHAVGLEQILTRALALAARLFGTPVPAPLLPARDDLFSRLLALSASTRHPQTRPRRQKVADLALLLREMSLRLPGNLLLVHLAHKMSTLVSPSPAPPAA
jgi:hypothetical protein